MTGETLVDKPAEAPAPPARPRPGRLRTGPFAALRGLLARPLASYYLLLASVGMLLLIGLVMVFSATSLEDYRETGNAFASVVEQVVSAVVGLVAFWICQRLPVRTYRGIAGVAMAVAFVLMILLDVLGFIAATRDADQAAFGPIVGRQLWLYLGPVQLQPAEVAKLALVLWLANAVARKGPAIVRGREVGSLFPIPGLLLALVGYNDLGSMICLLVLFVGILWAAGVRLRVFALLSLVALAGITVLIMLPGKSYRIERLTVFLDPEGANKETVGYHFFQGLYAISSGGWFGVGLGESPHKWGRLPNGHNDYIFALIAEELGVVGSCVVLALFAVLAYTGLRIARRVDDRFRCLAAAGITTWFVGQATINIGGVTGIMPLTGLPLPFISDGGTALVVALAAAGILTSFARAEPDAARALHARPPRRWVRLVWAPLPPLPRAPRPADGGRRPAQDGVGRGRPAPERVAGPKARGRSR